MIRLLLEDDTTLELDEAAPTIADLADWETYAIRRGLPTSPEEAMKLISATFTLYMVWAAYRRTVDAPAEFDAWRSTIVTIEQDADEVLEVPPTQPDRQAA